MLRPRPSPDSEAPRDLDQYPPKLCNALGWTFLGDVAGADRSGEFAPRPENRNANGHEIVEEILLPDGIAARAYVGEHLPDLGRIGHAGLRPALQRTGKIALDESFVGVGQDRQWRPAAMQRQFHAHLRGEDLHR